MKVTAHTITDAQISELHAAHKINDHVRDVALLTTGIGLNAERRKAHARCAEILNAQSESRAPKHPSEQLMMKRYRDVQAADDRRWARELQKTAADYVGKQQALAMAKRGYFKAEVERSRSAGNKPPWQEADVAASLERSATARARGAADVYSQGVADGAADRPHAPTDHPEYVAGYREGASLRR